MVKIFYILALNSLIILSANAENKCNDSELSGRWKLQAITAHSYQIPLPREIHVEARAFTC